MAPIKTCAFLALYVLLIVLSVFYVDRPVVWFFVAHHTHQFEILRIFAEDIVRAISIFIFIYYIYYAISVLVGRCVAGGNRSLLACCHAVVIGQFLRTMFELIFGRYWPATFICNNPSLVNTHDYAFNWFRRGTEFRSFPSGHTAFIVSFSTAMWFIYPKLRWLWVLLATLVVIGQISLYFHFVSDVMAGALLGVIVGYLVTHYKQASPIKV